MQKTNHDHQPHSSIDRNPRNDFYLLIHYLFVCQRPKLRAVILSFFYSNRLPSTMYPLWIKNSHGDLTDWRVTIVTPTELLVKQKMAFPNTKQLQL